MLQILTSAISMVCVLFLAFFLKKFNFLKKEAFYTLSTLVVKVTLPCAIITNFSGTDFDLSLLFLAPIGFFGTLSMIFLGWFTARKKSRDQQAFHMINHSGYNIGTFAIPYLENFAGASGVISACMFDLGNAILCTGGTYALASSVQESKGRISVLPLLKKTFSSVPTLAYLFMAGLGLLGLSLPSPVLSFAKIGAGANSFLAMSMLGVGLELTLNPTRWKTIGRVLALRYGAAAVFALAAWFLLPFSHTVKRILAVLFFSPLASFDPIFTSYCHGDVGLSSEINSVSILLSLVFMTFLFLFL